MSVKSRLDLLSNAGAGNGIAQTLSVGGKYFFMGEANFAAGSLKLQFQSPQGTWIDFPGATLTVAGSVALDVPPGQYRGVAITSTACYAWLVPA